MSKAKDSGQPKTAKKLRRLDGFNGEAWLYELSPPMPHPREGENATVAFVVSSAANTLDHGPETFLFPADADGKVLNWGELHGSIRGRMDNDAAIEEAGYSILCETKKAQH